MDMKIHCMYSVIDYKIKMNFDYLEQREVHPLPFAETCLLVYPHPPWSVKLRSNSGLPYRRSTNYQPSYGAAELSHAAP
jgi:hypothetical protein